MTGRIGSIRTHHPRPVLGLLSLALGALALSARVAGAACGDGILDLGELCDPGPDPTGSCCTALCTFALPGTVCRSAEGACDEEETCSGLAGDCPTNAFKPAGECRPSAGPCDLPESCSGIGPACPVDSLQPAGAECRSSAGPCDAPEVCTGTALDCPADTGEPDGDQDGTCDLLDVCPLIADPTQADADGDGMGDACDPCTNPDEARLSKTRLALSRLSAPPDDDRLRLKAGMTVPDQPAIDPVKKGMRLVLAGPVGTVFDAFVPPGSFDTALKVGWKNDGPGRWSYKNAGKDVPRVAGISKILLRQDRALTRQLRIIVAGRGGDLRAAVGQPTLTMTVVIDAPVAATGQCAESSFITAGPESACRLLNGGHRLECREKE